MVPVIGKKKAVRMLVGRGSWFCSVVLRERTG